MICSAAKKATAEQQQGEQVLNLPISVVFDFANNQIMFAKSGTKWIWWKVSTVGGSNTMPCTALGQMAGYEL
jgi:hypothetical protein